MTDVVDFPSASCPVCGEAASWDKGPKGGLLLTCSACGLERADADEVERRLGAPEFEAIDEGRYRLDVLGTARFEVDYLRREGHQLKGELLVRSDLPGARTYSGVLSVGDFNFSSARVRSTHAKYLAERAQAKDLDWIGWLEEFSQRVLAAERQGQPSVLLSHLPRPEPDETLDIDGLPLLARHPMIVFGDGGTAKSYLALYLAGTLAQRGKNVGFTDWELCGEDHRDRLERLFGEEMPLVHYVRCARPLFHEVDRLRRVVKDQGLEYIVFDSIAPACDGPPESAEVTGRYFQALRQLGEIGSLHIAHVTKALESADRRPFGSTFWHNLARATWNVKLEESTPDDRLANIALHNRKANLMGKRPSVGFEFHFDTDRTRVRRINILDNEELAATLTVAERIKAALRSGPRPRKEIESELDSVEPSTFRVTLNRTKKRGDIIEFPDGRIALAERWQR